MTSFHWYASASAAVRSRWTLLTHLAVQPLEEHTKGDIKLVRCEAILDVGVGHIHGDGQFEQIADRRARALVDQIVRPERHAVAGQRRGQRGVQLRQLLLVLALQN